MCCGLNSIDVVSDHGEEPSFAPANSVGSKALVSSAFQGFFWLQMCFLDATDSDCCFHGGHAAGLFTCCVPMHHLDWLMSIGCS